MIRASYISLLIYLLYEKVIIDAAEYITVMPSWTSYLLNDVSRDWLNTLMVMKNALLTWVEQIRFFQSKIYVDYLTMSITSNANATIFMN